MVGIDDLVYPASQEQLELDVPTFAAADGLIANGETLQNLLTLNDEVSAELAEQALTGVSYGAREAQLSSRAGLNRSRALDAGPAAVRGDQRRPGRHPLQRDGDFVATVTNRLDQPVTVLVEARSDGGIEITPPEPVELAAKSRTSVVLDAHVRRPRCHQRHAAAHRRRRAPRSDRRTGCRSGPPRSAS